MFDTAFKFSHVGVLFIVQQLLHVRRDAARHRSASLFVVPPQKLPPALQAVDAFGPLIAAVLIVWLPAQRRADRRSACSSTRTRGVGAILMHGAHADAASSRSSAC